MKVLNDNRFTAAGDDSGSAPGDRMFRPDVQGLRAVAILLVVLFHANIPGFGGGYVGVDVFFVISGFVITGVLLREQASTGSTSVLAFYARRARRIIPAATLVIIATVLAAYFFLGSVIGRSTAVDGQWASVFLANFHFSASATNYLASQRPPSPLQNFWSLAVEEQFYIVYPMAFILVAGLFTRRSLRSRIGIVLGATAVVSYALSIAWTSTNASSAFFSPLTRAWELALGGLVAVSSDNLRRLPSSVAAGISWVGLGGIMTAAFVLNSASTYPGSLVAIPVIGAGLVIAGGAVQPRWGVECVLQLRPFQLLGLVSYSLYLWHWPIIIIATQRQGTTSLPVGDNVLLLLAALVVATGTYRLVENPIRHSGALVAQPWASIAMGCALILSSLTVTTLAVQHIGQNVAGDIAAAAPGSMCHAPSRNQVVSLHAAFISKHPAEVPSRATHQLRMVVVGDSTACTMLVGLAAVGRSYGVQVEDGAVIGCGIVSGRIPPYYYGNVDLERATKDCPSEVAHAETAALGRGTPDIILWGSTEESGSIVDDTPAGSKVLTAGTPEWKAVMLQRMDVRVRQFVATGAKVILLLEPSPAQIGSRTRIVSDRHTL